MTTLHNNNQYQILDDLTVGTTEVLSSEITLVNPNASQCEVAVRPITLATNGKITLTGVEVTLNDNTTVNYTAEEALQIQNLNWGGKEYTDTGYVFEFTDATKTYKLFFKERVNVAKSIKLKFIALNAAQKLQITAMKTLLG